MTLTKDDGQVVTYSGKTIGPASRQESLFVLGEYTLNGLSEAAGWKDNWALINCKSKKAK